MFNLSRNASTVKTPEVTYSKLAYYATSSAQSSPYATKNHYASADVIPLFYKDLRQPIRQNKCPNLFGNVCLCAVQCSTATPKNKAVAS